MKQFLFLGLLILGFFSQVVSQNNSYDTKFTTTNTKAFGYINNNTNLVVAGDANYNIIQFSDGKLLADKTYSSTGFSAEKADIVNYCQASSMLIIGNTKTNTIAAVEALTGEKKWELSTFVNLRSAKLNIFDGYLLISEQKDKKNNTLTCYKVSSGTKLWTIENEPTLISSIIYIPEEKIIYIPSNTDYAYRNKVQSLRFINIEKGNIEFSVDVTGWIAATMYEKNEKMLFVHNLVQETNSSVSCISIKDKKIKWTTKATNKTPQTPILAHDFYSSFRFYNNTVLLVTEGIEVFDMNSGTQKYNIAYRPFVPSGPGHYTDGVFEPFIMNNYLIIADVLKGDISIKSIDINTGQTYWATEPEKGKVLAPIAHFNAQTNSVIIQYGGVCNFVSQSNAGTTTLKTPCSVASFDINSGKKKWSIEFKKGVFDSGINNDKLIVFSGNEIQTIDLLNGTVINTAISEFDEKLFVTKSAWVKSTNNSGKAFDFQNRLFIKISNYGIKQISF